MNRYFIGLLAAIGLIILILILVFSNRPTSPKPASTVVLPSYANTDAVVRETISGPVVAEQNHSVIQITVGQNSTVFNLIQGYNNNVVSSKTYPNTESSYRAFLYSLYYSGYTNGDSSSKLANNLGVCPTGNTYTFELIENGRDIQRYWATNCGGVTRTYNGNLSMTIYLFRVQVPDYNTLSQNANIS